MGSCTTITIPKVVASGTTPGTSASPGFQYGRAGNISAPTYLQVVATVPSNTAGTRVPFDGFITSIWTDNEAVNTYSLQVRRKDGVGGFVDVVGALLTMTAKENDDVSLLVPVTAGWILGIQMTVGSGRNVQAGVIIEQSP